MDRNSITNRILIITVLMLAVIGTLSVSCAPAAGTTVVTTQEANGAPGISYKYAFVERNGVTCILFQDSYHAQTLVVSCDWSNYKGNLK